VAAARKPALSWRPASSERSRILEFRKISADFVLNVRSDKVPQGEFSFLAENRLTHRFAIGILDADGRKVKTA